MKSSIIPIIFVSIFSVHMAYCQDEIEMFAINPKMGMYNSSNNDGLAYGIEIGFMQNKLIYSVDY